MTQAQATKQARERFYDTIADQFDDVMNRYDLERRIEIVFDTLLGGRRLEGCTLLDAGCGTGWFAQQAAALGARVTALDIGVRLLEKASEKCDAELVAGDVCHLPFHDSTFEIVISSECIEHSQNPLDAVRELCRVLKPNGTLVITVPNKLWHWSATFAAVFKLRPYEGLENWLSWREMRRGLCAEHMRIVTMSGFHLFPPLFRASWPMLRYADKFGGALGPLMLNLAVKAVK